MQLGKRFRALALAGVGLFVIAACGGSTTSNNNGGATILTTYKPIAGVAGGQLVFSDWEAVSDLNVISSSAQTTTQITNIIWATTWAFDPTNNPYPDLVAEVPTVANGDVKKVDATHMDVTIRLRPGLKWSDGQPITTADLHFTIDAICDPATGAASQTGFDHIASITDTSDTVEVWHFGPELTQSVTDSSGKPAYRCGLAAPLTDGTYAPYITLGQQIMPKHVLATVKHADWATNSYFTTMPTVSSGAYMVQNFTPGPAAQVVLVPNPHYADGRSGAPFFGHAPYLTKLIYKIYGDKPSQIAGLKAGDTDLGLDLIANDLPAVNGITGYTAVHATGLADEYLTFNTQNNKTGCDSQQFAATCGTPTIFKDDKVLRQAVALAIDKNQINTSLVQGIGFVMNGPFPPAMAPYTDSSIPAFARDVATANTLLDGDGWVKAADGTRSKNGKKLAWVMSTTSGNAQRAAEEAQMIKNWVDIGATVTTKNFVAGHFFDPFSSGGVLATGQFDLGMFTNAWAPDPDSLCSVIETSKAPSASNPSGQNYSFASDPKLDTLCAQGAAEVDVSKRIAIYKQVQAEWKDFTPTTELYVRPEVFTQASYFGNFAPDVGAPCVATCNAADWFNTKGKS